MQYSIESVVGECDYKTKVNGKVKTYHANLLKRFHQREDKDTANIVSGGPVWDLLSAAILEAEDCGVEDAIKDNDLMFFGSSQSFNDRTAIKQRPGRAGQGPNTRCSRDVH